MFLSQYCKNGRHGSSLHNIVKGAACFPVRVQYCKIKIVWGTVSRQGKDAKRNHEGIQDFFLIHCPKNNLNLRIKPSLLSWERNSLCPAFANQCYQIYTVASAPTVTGLVLCGYSDYFWDSVHAYECIQELKELTEGGGGVL